MGTPARALILDNIKTTLAVISIAGGYKTTVTKVERYLRDWADVDPTEMPWIGFFPGAERPQHQPGEMLRMVMPIIVVAHIETVVDEDLEVAHRDRTTKISNLVDDIVAALMVDIRRDSNASSTRYIAPSQTDEGVPDYVSDRGGVVSAQMNFEIVYFRTTGRS